MITSADLENSPGISKVKTTENGIRHNDLPQKGDYFNLSPS